MVAISDDPKRWDPGSTLLRRDGTELVVEDSRTHKGDRLLVKFEGVATRSEAEALRGSVYVSSEQRRELGDDHFWQDELVGCAVATVDGSAVGEVSGIVAGPAQDLVSVESVNGGAFLVPLVKAIVVEVDVDAKRLVIDPPPGLLD